MARLKGKIAIVSGASRGIGAAIATLFVQEGATVILGAPPDDQLNALAENLNTTRGSEVAVVAELDVRQLADWTKLVTLAEVRFGGLDILVNNAGVMSEGDIETCGHKEWAETIDVNQMGVFLGMKAAIPAMRKRGGGSIVNMSSAGGIVASPIAAAYHASKGAVRQLTKHAAIRYGRENIRCNAICPGPILTEMLSRLPEKNLQGAAKTTGLKRLGKVEEVAQVAVFLASDESSYVTGIDLPVDGGFTAM